MKRSRRLARGRSRRYDTHEAKSYRSARAWPMVVNANRGSDGLRTLAQDAERRAAKEEARARHFDSQHMTKDAHEARINAATWRGLARAYREKLP